MTSILPFSNDCIQSFCISFYKDIGNSRAAFYGLAKETSKKFIIELKNQNDETAELIVSLLSGTNESSEELLFQRSWIEHAFTPKIVKWIETMVNANESIVQSSNSLLCLDEYNQLYNQLKVKYGLKMVEVSKY